MQCPPETGCVLSGCLRLRSYRNPPPEDIAVTQFLKERNPAATDKSGPGLVQTSMADYVVTFAASVTGGTRKVIWTRFQLLIAAIARTRSTNSFSEKCFAAS